jgi:signal transduction histidine kinase
MALLSLVGEHAATSIEHAILYARVRAQADAIDRMAAIQRDFLRSVSHDLQTPLTSIRALAGEVRAQPDLDDQASHDLDLIEHQADRLRRMVSQLLVVSRLEAGVVEPQLEVVNPRPLIERTWSALRIPERQLRVDLSGPPLLAVADPDRLEQVLWAVIDNAIKYSPAGGGVHVSIGGDGDRARIAIRDEGVGMDARTVAQAFEQFYRSPEARRVAPNGSGIGLFAARGLMQAMGGSISINSQLGQGTTITLELPAEHAEETVP